ncbi:DHHA1 domain-containing protein [Bacillus sp. SM2101]|uniref:DHHA1 domain-containing protein n=1 Tax=Bacillaceae TaxID=186817 RepID=UPI001BDE0728|nr:DHHA1 domain-containing protein [Bacillus sp. SM2101]
MRLTNPINFTESDELLLELEEEAIERYIYKLEKGIVIYELTGDKQVGVVFADRYQSEAGHELLNRLNLDAIIMIDANNRKISMRSKPNIDVGEIAKRLGGGGHKNAAGVEFNYESIDDFHGSKYSLFGFYQNYENTIFDLYWKFHNTFEDIETEAVSQMFGEYK